MPPGVTVTSRVGRVERHQRFVGIRSGMLVTDGGAMHAVKFVAHQIVEITSIPVVMQLTQEMVSSAVGYQFLRLCKVIYTK